MLPPLVRRVSYIPAVRRMVIATGLRSVAQRAYYRGFAPAGGILRVSYGGACARFATPSVRELRALETFASSGDSEFRCLLNMIQDGEVFWDVGAQYGAYAFLVANAIGSGVRVAAFEPFPRDFALLQENARLNHATNVLPINAALSDFEGKVAMSTSDGGEEFCPRIGKPTAMSCSVRAVRGDTLIESGAAPFPNVIKLDVEGHEFEVLRGLSDALDDPRCHSIYCEIHDAILPRGKALEIVSFLRSKGFQWIVDAPGPNHYIFAEKKAGASFGRIPSNIT